jgi:hypothetical protein
MELSMSIPLCVGVEIILLTRTSCRIARVTFALLAPDGTECRWPREGDSMEAAGISYSCGEAARWGWRNATGAAECATGEEG